MKLTLTNLEANLILDAINSKMRKASLGSEMEAMKQIKFKMFEAANEQAKNEDEEMVKRIAEQKAITNGDDYRSD